jgi:hypothetical protein
MHLSFPLAICKLLNDYISRLLMCDLERGTRTLSIIEAGEQAPLTAFREFIINTSFTLVSEFIQGSIDFSRAHLVNVVTDVHK